MARRLALLGSVLVAACLLAAGTPAALGEGLAGATEVQRESPRVLLGVLGSRDRFDALTGQRTVVGHVIAGWGQGPVERILAALGEVPMLGLKTGGLSLRDIAYGRGDDYLLELNRVAGTLPGRVYIRPFPEMNGHWNTYCAFNHDGSPRGPATSTAMFRRAFARLYVVVHGGPLARVNRKLAGLGLPPVRARELADNPMPRVRIVWNPQGYGSPDVPGNTAAAYYPGDGYVDVVANDLYNIRGKAEWAANERLYDAHPNKPFAMAEWANWGFDDPNFIRAMADFARTHRRVELLAYYNGRPGSPWDIQRQPRSRQAYRSLIVPLGR